MQYGACYYDYYAKQGCESSFKDAKGRFNSVYYYKGEPHVSTHAVSIIGWDDFFDKNHFINYDNTHPAHNGAWLVKDSSGEDDEL